MKVVGLITEYNPFHNGHVYHIQKARELTNADYVIIVMSGDYVQRGVPALIDKYTRTEMALSCGADLVIELPVAYSTGSAEYFAMGAVTLLDHLGIVDYICFGSECGDITMLDRIANHLSDESPLFQTAIKNAIKSGHSYPTARCMAIAACRNIPGALDEKDMSDIDEIQRIIGQPNNILGIEYLKSIKRLNSSIEPLTIKREGADYHDIDFAGTMISATAIRQELIAGRLSSIQNGIPESVYEILNREYQKSFPIIEDDFSSLLYYRILLEKENNMALSKYQDVSKDMGLRIYNELDSFSSYQNFAEHIKTKQHTLTRIYRSLLHILLDIGIKDYKFYSSYDFVSYVRILGFSKASSDLLTSIKQSSTLPIITKMADANHLLPTAGKRMLQQEVFASDLYRKIQEIKFNTTLPNEFTRGLIIY